MAQLIRTLTITEFCIQTGIHEEDLREIVGLGIVSPLQSDSDNWLFDDLALVVTHRAVRLHHELEIDWPGIAFALHLLNENESLKRENILLQQQLTRFIDL
ncbi:TPA: chaperone modulator CbpM [Morganella morganii]|uniref:chaperone modulator CbpM n=1 Tax=Morganella morganii TaxID=582 RepID=UPI0034D67561|nr:chaperone modulator CbpM [Morganella morganii]